MGCTSSHDQVIPVTACDGQLTNWHEAAPRSLDGTANSPAHYTPSDERSPSRSRSLRVNHRTVMPAGAAFVLAPNPLRGPTYNLDNDALPPHADARPFRASCSVADAGDVTLHSVDHRSNSTSAYLSRSALEAASMRAPTTTTEARPDSPVTTWLQALPASPMEQSLCSMDGEDNIENTLQSLSMLE